MSSTVKYKGATIATVDNDTATLDTAGTWLEDDIEITDVSSGGGITYEQIADRNFGLGDDVVVTGDLVYERAFACSKIRSVVANTANIQTGAFYGCSQLVSATLGTISDFWGRNNIFQNCSSLVDVDIPNGGRF